DVRFLASTLLLTRLLSRLSSVGRDRVYALFPIARRAVRFFQSVLSVRTESSFANLTSARTARDARTVSLERAIARNTSMLIATRAESCCCSALVIEIRTVSFCRRRLSNRG